MSINLSPNSRGEQGESVPFMPPDKLVDLVECLTKARMLEAEQRNVSNASEKASLDKDRIRRKIQNGLD